jgi:hypothetical protein
MRRGRNKIVVTAEQEGGTDTEQVELQPAGSVAGRERLVTATDQALTAVASTVVPALMEARERLAPVAGQMSQGKKLGRKAAARGLVKGKQTKKRGRRAAATNGRRAAAKSLVKGKHAAVRLGMLEEHTKPTHKFRNLLILLGLGGAAALGYKMLTGKDADPAWTAGRDSAAPADPVSTAPVNESDSVPWGDTPPADQMPGMDPTAVDPVVAEPAGSDPLDHEVPATTDGSVDGSDTAPTAPLASEESVASPVPTTPDEPLEERDLT